MPLWAGGGCEERERELKTKKKWDKPKLIILTRGKPEESVLVSCKADPLKVGGPDSNWDWCDVYGCWDWCLSRGTT